MSLLLSDVVLFLDPEVELFPDPEVVLFPDPEVVLFLDPEVVLFPEVLVFNGLVSALTSHSHDGNARFLPVLVTMVTEGVFFFSTLVSTATTEVLTSLCLS